MMPTKPLRNTKTAWLPPGAHKTVKRIGATVYLRITAGRGRGAPVIGKYKAPTEGAAEKLAQDDREALFEAARNAKSAGSGTSTALLAGVLLRWEASEDFKKNSDNTKKRRFYQLRGMRASSIGKLPTIALKAKRATAVITAWRDGVAAERGNAAADQWLALLKRALTWAKAQGYVDANPALGIADLWFTDRSDLIWEDEHLEKYFAHIEAERLKVTRPGNPLPQHHQRRQIASLLAAERAVRLACGLGMRREDLTMLNRANRDGAAIVYTALKGMRRRRTAKKKAKVTIVPIRAPVAAVLDATPAEQHFFIVKHDGNPYQPGALGKLILAHAAAAGVDRHLHDCKGRFVTDMIDAGFGVREVAEMVDWSESDVEQIAARYVSAATIAKKRLDRINAAAQAGS